MDNEPPLRILNRPEVARCLCRIDAVAVAERVLRRHADGSTILPAEGYLPWRNDVAGDCRSLAMLGALTGDADAPAVYGLKVINAASSNPAHGLDRAGGVGLIFDPETARPVMMVEVGLISALRTAAYTALSIRELGPVGWTSLALVGTGVQAAVHLDVIAATFPSLRELHLYDLDRTRSEAFAAQAAVRHPDLDIRIARDAVTAAARAGVVVTATTSSSPYLGPEAFTAGTFIANVSLDDVNADVLLDAEGLFVDDVALVQDNPRRILGKLMQEGRILPPGEPARADARPVNGTLGDVLTGRRPAIRPASGFVVSNPFGMSILDIGLLDAVRAEAELHDIGLHIDLVPDAGRYA